MNESPLQNDFIKSSGFTFFIYRVVALLLVVITCVTLPHSVGNKNYIYVLVLYLISSLSKKRIIYTRVLFNCISNVLSQIQLAPYVLKIIGNQYVTHLIVDFLECVPFSTVRKISIGFLMNKIMWIV